MANAYFLKLKTIDRKTIYVNTQYIASVVEGRSGGATIELVGMPGTATFEVTDSVESVIGSMPCHIC